MVYFTIWEISLAVDICSVLQIPELHLAFKMGLRKYTQGGKNNVRTQKREREKRKGNNPH